MATTGQEVLNEPEPTIQQRVEKEDFGSWMVMEKRGRRPARRDAKLSKDVRKDILSRGVRIKDNRNRALPMGVAIEGILNRLEQQEDNLDDAMGADTDDEVSSETKSMVEIHD
ncbi:hypothetical protein GOBAR_DD06758 [Gossypium barbadense]|nr:hypothetical protein GOBAR_DD06758 [Gossypium barbadense]